MILQISPHAPALVRVAATAALYTHIGGASLALVAGPAAMIANKGGRVHRIAGDAFFVSMLCMAGVGAVVAPMFPDRISGLAGALAFYLVATGWAAAMRRDGRIGRFEVGAALFGVAVAAAGVMLGLEGMRSGRPELEGEPWQIAFGLAAMAGIATASDLKVLLARGIDGAPRIARHLWRMGLALFMAAGSFAGQPKAQPEIIRGSPFLIVPALAILAATLFWLIRTRLPRRARSRLGQHAAA